MMTSTFESLFQRANNRYNKHSLFGYPSDSHSLISLKFPNTLHSLFWHGVDGDSDEGEDIEDDFGAIDVFNAFGESLVLDCGGHDGLTMAGSRPSRVYLIPNILAGKRQRRGEETVSCRKKTRASNASYCRGTDEGERDENDNTHHDDDQDATSASGQNSTSKRRMVAVNSKGRSERNANSSSRTCSNSSNASEFVLLEDHGSHYETKVFDPYVDPRTIEVVVRDTGTLTIEERVQATESSGSSSPRIPIYKTFVFPMDADQAQMKITFCDGVLTLHVPKTATIQHGSNDDREIIDLTNSDDECDEEHISNNHDSDDNDEDGLEIISIYDSDIEEETTDDDRNEEHLGYLVEEPEDEGSQDDDTSHGLECDEVLDGDVIVYGVPFRDWESDSDDDPSIYSQDEETSMDFSDEEEEALRFPTSFPFYNSYYMMW